MYLQCFRVFLLGVVDLCFVKTVVGSEIPITTTVHTMCERVCHQRTRCSLFVNSTCNPICNKTYINKVQQTDVKGSDLIKVTKNGERLCKNRTKKQRNKETRRNIQCIKIRAASRTSPAPIAAKPRGDGNPVRCDSSNFHMACRQGDISSIKNILYQRLENINCRGKMGRTPIMIAAQKRQVEVFNFLVLHGCDLSAVDVYKDTVLHMACEGGDKDIIRKLIFDKKYDIESKGMYGVTPVMKAAFYGRRGVVALLVLAGCNMSVVDDNSDNFLHWACRGGDVGIVNYILSHDIVDIESRGWNGRTPVMNAVNAGNRKVVDLLVRRGCNLKALDNNEETVLHCACRSGDVDIVKFILSKDIVSIDSRGRTGVAPVMRAVFKGNMRVLDLLISRGCDPTLVDSSNNTILHIACDGGHIQMVKYILFRGITGMDSKGIGGRTPVMIAAYRGHSKVVSLLVTRGCNLTAVDNYMNTILHWACQGGHVDTVRYILSTNAADIDMKGVDGITPVMIAVKEGFRRIFYLLVSRGCDLKAVNDDNENILHWACFHGQTDMVKYLLSKHICDVNSRGQRGKTPVMLAVQKGHREVFQTLVCNGCNLKAVDCGGNTVSHVACIGGHVPMVKYLIKLGVMDVHEKNSHGQTPAEIAASKGFGDVIDLLKARK